jgi:hypothetical protein
MLTAIEAALVLASLALACCASSNSLRWLSPAERAFRSLAQKRALSVFIVGALALLARVAVLGLLPVPEPHITDEFSYLLLANTLMHHRLANPLHPMWIHFETFQVIMHPTYASMYPPAQGLFLALGRLISGNAFTGVCLSVALMCASICWMLQGWLPAEWALLGGLMAVARLAVFSYWANNYGGGAVAAAGGALLLGGLPRSLRSQRPRDALLIGAGLAILANSRPYEGFILSLPVAAVLLGWLLSGRGQELGRAALRVALPLTLLLALSALGTGYYFWRVTGSPIQMPYQVDRNTYAVAPYFIWQSARPLPAYNHQDMRYFYGVRELDFYKSSRSLAGYVDLSFFKIARFWFFYLGPAFTLPLICAIALLPYGFSWSRMSWEQRFLLAVTAISVAGLGLEVFFYPHYAAPMTGLVYLWVILALRSLCRWTWHSRPIGRVLALAIPLSCFSMLAIRVAAGPLHLSLGSEWLATPYNARPIQTARARVEAELRAIPGDHLVLVHVGPDPQSDSDWVYNDAEIDSSKIVWARDMGAKNQELLDYYKNRQVWLMDTDQDIPQLRPYLPSSLARSF